MDANLALTMILLLMISLLGMNMAYFAGIQVTGEHLSGIYPVSGYFSKIMTGLSSKQIGLFYEICWWSHILLIFAFANILPYSKHFHVFMSVPNVFLSRLEPLGKLPNMENITREVKMMLDPSATFDSPDSVTPVERFGIKDAEDISWKNYFDSLACTECGRCTAVCPANLTGKRLSPRKIMMDVRARMKEKGPGILKLGKTFSDNRSLLRDYISEEELWACTTCNACARECPISINHPILIIDMRRYLVMEEASAPSGIKWVFSNIENNGAAWQFSSDDRLLWAKNIELHIN
jgi:heterodisulfide reductase subunit C